jgi:hypothetical protein
MRSEEHADGAIGILMNPHHGLDEVGPEPALRQLQPPTGPGAVRRLVGIEVGVVSGVFNLESPGVDAPGWRLRHEEAYHAA